jgi:hypothetical protein
MNEQLELTMEVFPYRPTERFVRPHKYTAADYHGA